MPQKRYSTEQIVTKLRQAEVELGRGLRTPEMCKKLGVSEQTYYRWRKEYGGLRLEQAKRLKELERENGRLKKLVADQALDNMILKRWPRETSEPVPTPAGGGVCPPSVAGLGEAGLSRDWPRAVDTPACGRGAGG